MTRRWPAEWEPHEGTILFFPHNPGIFRCELAISEFCALAETLSKSSETVRVFCKNESHREATKGKLRKVPNIVVDICPTDDTWARDTAPTFVIQDDDRLLGLDWGFNAYGGEKDGCYWPCLCDQKIAQNVCEILKIPSHQVDLILEGGAIHTDGEGTILTTKECLLNSNRNPNLSQTEIESILLQHTGCSKVLWLELGLAHDEDTNGHIDNFCCFVRPTEVVLAWTDDTTDTENYARCRAALETIRSSTDARGRSIKVHKLTLPSPLYYTKDIIDSLVFGKYEETNTFPRSVGDRMAASYVNFYIGNKVVLVPQFGDLNDSLAVQKLVGLFPDRTVVGIPSKEILIGGGNIHCVTQQIPKAN